VPRDGRPRCNVAMSEEDANETDRKRRLAETLDDEDGWREWYRMTPQERWQETANLWQFYLSVGGSLDPEPDPQSPFDAVMPRGTHLLMGGRRACYTARPSLAVIAISCCWPIKAISRDYATLSTCSKPSVSRGSAIRPRVSGERTCDSLSLPTPGSEGNASRRDDDHARVCRIHNAPATSPDP
jgi:hypothetical protein